MDFSALDDELRDLLLEQLAATLGVGVALANADDGCFVYANPEFVRMMALAPQEILGRSFLDMTHPDDRARSVTQQHRLLAGAIDGYKMDKRFIGADGDVVWVHVVARAVRGRIGNVRWIAAAIEDISEAVHHQRQMIAVQQSAELASWSYALTSRVASLSPSFREMLELPPNAQSEWSLEAILDRVHGSDRANVARTINRAITHRAGYVHEYRIVPTDGRIRRLRGMAMCVYDHAGEADRLVGVTVDITDAKARTPAPPVDERLRAVAADMESNWNQPFSLKTLAWRHGISVRAIHRHFADKGTTPLRYLKAIRLGNAHGLLSRPRGDTTVSGVAIACGFSNFGHFAKDYRDAFGERPSETLKREADDDVGSGSI